jgi:ElaB/YqjD/DUF883 family membrane-anchored ribosome-binding protein
MEPNKNGSNVSSTAPAGSAQSSTTAPVNPTAPRASTAAPRVTPKSSVRGRTTGTMQDTVGVNTSRDTSGAFVPRDAGYSSGQTASADSASIGASGVRVRNDARQLMESITTFTTQAQETITKTLDERPYVALGTAFGIGYLLGGGLRSKLTGLALTVGGRYFLNTMGNQLLGQVRR